MNFTFNNKLSLNFKEGNVFLNFDNNIFFILQWSFLKFSIFNIKKYILFSYIYIDDINRIKDAIKKIPWIVNKRFYLKYRVFKKIIKS